MDIRRVFLRFCQRIEKIIVPQLKYSQLLYEAVLQSYVNTTVKWLDLGCGHRILPSWREKMEKDLVGNCGVIVGVDYDLDSLIKHRNINMKVRGNMNSLPFQDSCFDLATANMVIEHLNNPNLQFQEVRRILKPNGIFIFHTPNKFCYTTILARLIPEVLKEQLIYLFHGRKEEDIFHTYYRANSTKTINMLAETVGFQVRKIKMIVSSPQFVIIPPIMLLELIWLKILMTKACKPLRNNIIAILQK